MELLILVCVPFPLAGWLITREIMMFRQARGECASPEDMQRRRSFVRKRVQAIVLWTLAFYAMIAAYVLWVVYAMQFAGAGRGP
mgnify:CR=1 FL=1